MAPTGPTLTASFGIYVENSCLPVILFPAVSERVK
jgi:hypothetical protein